MSLLYYCYLIEIIMHVERNSVIVFCIWFVTKNNLFQKCCMCFSHSQSACYSDHKQNGPCTESIITTAGLMSIITRLKNDPAIINSQGMQSQKSEQQNQNAQIFLELRVLCRVILFVAASVAHDARYDDKDQ